MTSGASQEIRGLGRRALLRNGLLLSLGTSTVVAASASLAGEARAGAPAPASADILAATAPEQFGWAWCDLCQGMFYSGNNTLGHCPYNGNLFGHANKLDYSSYNYGFYYNATGTDWQAGWLWCRNCQGMFWAPSGHTSYGQCPFYNSNGQTGAHNGSGSFAYVAYRGSATGTGQAGWLWCKNCSGLFYAQGTAQFGIYQIGPVCPVNGGLNSRNIPPTYTPHDGSTSSHYYIPHSGWISLGPPQMMAPAR
jgi:hypothetical protein